MWMSVVDSIVFHVQEAPAYAKAALIMPKNAGTFWPFFFSHCGTWTMESRGKLIATARSRFGDRCSRIVVSERSPLMSGDQ
jgi:hypothetical protein